MDSTAVVYFEDAISKKIISDPDYEFGRAFFESPDVAARPNSTLRLNLVNYRALRELSDSYPIDLFHYEEIRNSLADLLEYSQVVINSVASKRTISLLVELVSLVANSPNPPRLILGTEYSWVNNVRTGNVSQDLVDTLYRDHLMLRHTARTDKHLYEAEDFRGSRVQEFEIGVDGDSMPTAPPIAERMDILFVAAPEGRVTKNNDEIWEIRDELERRGLSEKFPVKVIAPPYTTAEYWDALRSARYIVFTSRGETFSYVLNDALAMGVIGIRRPELFATRTARFGVDAYWDVGIRYTSPGHAVDVISELSHDGEALAAESIRSSSLARKHFSPKAVKANWLRLLNGSSLNVASAYIVDLSKVAGGVEGALQRARAFDCKYVIAFMSRGLLYEDVTSYSLPSFDRSQVVLPYCYLESAERVRYVSPNLTNGRIVEQPNEGDVIDYLRLVLRTNKIRDVYVDAEVRDDLLDSALSKVKYLEGRDLVSLRVEYL